MAEGTLIAEDPVPTRLGRSQPEFAVSVVNPASLSVIGPDKSSRFAHWLATLDDPDLAEWLSNFVPTHFYIGSEFCEQLMPEVQTLRRAVRHALDLNCRTSLVTPIASPQVIRALGDLLPSLPEDWEVVVNDWGVAHFIKHRFPALRLIAGRILCRMIKDPRVGQAGLAGLVSKCNFDSRPLRAMFTRLGFCQMEIDVPMFADSNTFSALPMPTSVHVPFSCVSKGRMCRIGSIAIRGPERFAVGRKCKRECLKVSARLERPGTGDGLSVYQMGNSIFSKHSREMLDAVRTAVERSLINRLVVPGEAM